MKDAWLQQPHRPEWGPWHYWRCPCCQAPLEPGEGWCHAVIRPLPSGGRRADKVSTCESHYCRSKVMALPEAVNQ